MIISIIALILQIALIIILFSLPYRFREQQDYMEQRFKEMEEKLNTLQAMLKESAAKPNEAPSQPEEQPSVQQ